MINNCFKWLKTFLTSRVKKVVSLIALLFGIYINFLDLLFLDKFTIVLLALPLILKILLLSALNAYRAKFDNLVTFNNKVNNAVILLKPWIKHQ